MEDSKGIGGKNTELKTAMSVSEAQELFGILGAVVDECRATIFLLRGE